MSPSLQQSLENADARFNRRPVRKVYDRYVEYAAVEGSPHPEAVARWIASKEGIDFAEYGNALRHEVYLAGEQAREEARSAEHGALRNAGYRLATESTLIVGQRYDVLFDKDTAFGKHRTQVVCTCMAGPHGEVFLAPKHTRTKHLKIGGITEIWVREV